MSVGRVATSLLIAGALAATLLGGRAAADEAEVEASVGLGTGPAANAVGRAEPLLSLADCGTAATCWSVANLLRIAVTVSALGQSKTCAKRCRLPGTQVFAIGDDAFTIAPPLTFLCPSGSTASFGDGTVVPKRRKLFLEPSNEAELEQTLPSCLDGAPAHFSSWVRPSKRHPTLRGRTVVRGHRRIGIAAERIAVKVRHKGVLVDTGAMPMIGGSVPECPATVVVRCVLRITR